MYWVYPQFATDSDTSSETSLERSVIPAIEGQPDSSTPSESEPIEIPDPLNVALAHKAVIPGIPGTAPLYWESYRDINDYPVVTGCVKSANHCRCYTQQATRIDMPDGMCNAHVDALPFDHSRDRPERQDSRIIERLENMIAHYQQLNRQRRGFNAQPYPSPSATTPTIEGENL